MRSGYARRTAIVDGVAEQGCFASDFTLAQIKTLRARQPLAFRPQQFNDRFEIPTFEEVLALAKRHKVGVYPETKHPTYHQMLGLPLEARLVAALKKAGWHHKRAPVFIQSFEQANLEQLNRMTDVRLVQLVDANDVNPDGTLDYTAPFDRPYDWTVSRVADINGDGTIGDENGDGLIGDADRVTLPPTSLIQRAHRKGLLIHTWTFRNEGRFLASDYEGNPLAEYRQFFRLGIDGVFSDFPDTAVLARWLG